MKLEELHNCEKCRGKLVMITVDHVGVERCGYCNEVVNYKSYIIKKLREHRQLHIR